MPCRRVSAGGPSGATGQDCGQTQLERIECIDRGGIRLLPHRLVCCQLPMRELGRHPGHCRQARRARSISAVAIGQDVLSMLPLSTDWTCAAFRLARVPVRSSAVCRAETSSCAGAAARPRQFAERSACPGYTAVLLKMTSDVAPVLLCTAGTPLREPQPCGRRRPASPLRQPPIPVRPRPRCKRCRSALGSHDRCEDNDGRAPLVGWPCDEKSRFNRPSAVWQSGDRGNVKPATSISRPGRQW